MEVDRIQNPLGVAQQIQNAIVGVEKYNNNKPDITRVAKDTIKEYYESNARVKELDESGNLVAQRVYIFKRKG